MDFQTLLQPGPQRKEVQRGVILGVLASAFIYYNFFYAPTQTKGKAESEYEDKE
jgi:hypothetical protein